MQPLEFDTTTPAWGELCRLATSLRPQFADSLRPCKDAMAVACRRRPDLAAAAMKKPAIAQAHGNADSPLIRAAERMAAARRG